MLLYPQSSVFHLFPNLHPLFPPSFNYSLSAYHSPSLSIIDGFWFGNMITIAKKVLPSSLSRPYTLREGIHCCKSVA